MGTAFPHKKLSANGVHKRFFKRYPFIIAVKLAISHYTSVYLLPGYNIPCTSNYVKTKLQKFVYPYLIYGVEIWGNACNAYIDPLIKLQKKCLRIITFSNYLAHTEPLFQKLEILNFKKLVIHRIAMLMFKNSKEIVPIAIHMLFARNDQYHNYNTRQSRSLHPSVGRGEAIYRSFSFHGVNIWNYLSKHIPVIVTYIRFNKLTKSYLLNNNIIYRLV